MEDQEASYDNNNPTAGSGESLVKVTGMYQDWFLDYAS